MMITRKTIMLTILISPVALLFTPVAHADCTSPSSASINVPNLVVQRDAPVGSQIGSEVVGGNTTFYTCPTGVNSPDMNFGIKTYGSYVTTINNERVYSTSIPGIGYSLGMEGTSQCTGAINYIGGSSNQLIQCWTKAALFSTYTASAKPRIKFYKIAPTTGSGTVSATQAGVMILQDAGTWRSEPSLMMNSFTVTTTACSVTNAAVKVPLGNVLSTAFTGAGSTAAEKNFTIDLNCDASTRVNLTLEGAQDSSGTAGVLALTQATTGATASGVGVQVLYNNSPVTFGSMFNVGTAATKGAYAIPLTARYYQTTEKVTGGQANSLATFTVTYQ
ncbi:type 1 fimbrial protein [Enterobacter asburiae]|uniref:fimbrial protein n=1 Tax=Enterobacter asburiae TaxID=61645 RepID=UPI002074F054|nr:fimbrial protein [Enterobacter asburiae]MCM7773445.1 type 1 fimbrial protein [Enterobacter asburiae]